MIVSFSGFQSFGKTTATYLLAAELKRRGLNLNLWTDIPRSSPIPINERGSSNTQYWIMSTMIKTYLDILSTYPLVLSDRTPFDCVVYELVNHQKATDRAVWSRTARAIYDLCLEFFRQNSHLILFTHRGFEHRVDSGRTRDNQFNELSRNWFNRVFEMLKTESGINMIPVDLTNMNIEDLIIQIGKISD